MKKIAFCLVLLMLFLSSVAFATEVTENKFSDSVNMFSLSFPSDYSIMTVKNMGNFTDYLNEKQVKSENLIKYFNEQGIEVYAFTPSSAIEVYVSVTSDQLSQIEYDIDRVPQEKLNEKIEFAKMQTYEQITTQKAEIITISGIKYVKVLCLDERTGKKMAAEYYTIKNGKYYDFAFYNSVEADLSNTEKKAEDILATLQFTQIFPPPHELVYPPEYNRQIMTIVMGVCIAGIVAVVAVMVYSDKKRKRLLEYNK